MTKLKIDKTKTVDRTSPVDKLDSFLPWHAVGDQVDQIVRQRMGVQSAPDDCPTYVKVGHARISRPQEEALGNTPWQATGQGCGGL